MNRTLLFWTVPVVGVILALATGISTLANNLSFYYGVPLGWRLAYCPLALPLACSPFEWLALFVDALFFAAIGYVVLTILFLVRRPVKSSRSNGSAKEDLVRCAKRC